MSCVLRAVTPPDEPPLLDAFLSAFTDSVEYCDWPEAAVQESAEESVRGFFAGARGEPLAVSRLAAAPGSASPDIVGAALVIRTPDGPLLDLLFVVPAHRRTGIATALVGAVLNELHAAGEAKLTSNYRLANAASRQVHLRFGFEEEPDHSVARAHHRFVVDQLRHRGSAGTLPIAERRALEAERDRWRRLLDEFERDVFHRVPRR